jgi:hypothetical protein
MALDCQPLSWQAAKASFPVSTIALSKSFKETLVSHLTMSALRISTQRTLNCPSAPNVALASYGPSMNRKATDFMNRRWPNPSNHQPNITTTKSDHPSPGNGEPPKLKKITPVMLPNLERSNEARSRVIIELLRTLGMLSQLSSSWCLPTFQSYPCQRGPLRTPAPPATELVSHTDKLDVSPPRSGSSTCLVGIGL